MTTERINVYTCPLGHQTVTRDADEGTTPFMIVCLEGGHRCGRNAVSAMYRPPEGAVPTHEWYKPGPRRVRRMPPAWRDHAERGGLFLRPIPPEPA